MNKGMKQQNYSNYKRYYPPHHFIFLPFTGALTIFCFIKAYNEQDLRCQWILLGVLSFCILYLAIMVRQHYALGNQNRIVRLEFRLRYFEFFAKSSKKAEKQLTFGQIAALRFTDDSEFEALLNRAIQENLSPDDIKKSIKNWQGDYMRR